MVLKQISTTVSKLDKISIYLLSVTLNSYAIKLLVY